MKTLLAFGDSNTHGSMPSSTFDTAYRFDRATRWPGVCAAALGPEWHVVEEGHPGRTTTLDDPTWGPHRNGSTVLPALLESHRPLDVVVLMLGTNDMKACYAMTALDSALSVERLLRIVASSASGPGGTAPLVLVIAPAPIRELGWLAEMFTGGAQKSNRLAGHLADVAKRQGASFLDAAAVTTVDPAEGVHLTAEGHQALGRAIAARVSELSG
ncbi:MAG: SGNH/GDSL hydrolase family protein [Pseudomonadota bacterium]